MPRRPHSLQSPVPTPRARRLIAAVAAALTLGSLSPAAQQPAPPSAQRPPVFRSGRDLVVVNVVVRDKSGALVRGLTRDDFTVLEDNRAQTVESFDAEELDAVASPIEIVTRIEWPESAWNSRRSILARIRSAICSAIFGGALVRIAANSSPP